MIQISLLKIILSFGFMQKQIKDSHNEFLHVEPHWSHKAGNFCEPYSFVSPCSVGALVTITLCQYCKSQLSNVF